MRAGGNATGIDDDAIVKAQAVAQGYLGQTKITAELTQAIVDLSTKTGSLDSAATALGKSIGTSTNALAREGLTLREGATVAEKYAAAISLVSVRYGDQAAAANKASFGVNGLKTAFGNLQEGIGARFAPAITLVATKLTEFLKTAEKNPALLDLAAAFIAAGLAIGGVLALAGPLTAAFTSLGAAAAAFGFTSTALLGPAGLLILTVGALTAGVVLLALNWDKSLLAMEATAVQVGTTISEIFTGLAQILAGIPAALTGSGEQVAEGFKRFNGAVAAGYDAAAKVTAEGEAKIAEQKKAALETQNKDKADAAAKTKAIEDAEKARKDRTTGAQDQLQLLQLQKASKEAIALKQEEVGILKNLETEKNAAVIAASEARIQQLRDLEDAQFEQDQERAIEFDARKKELLAQLEAEGVNTDPNANPLLDQQLEALRTQLQTKQDVENQYAAARLQATIKSDNEFLLNQKKFGTAYAVIYKAMHSEIYEGSKQAFGELAQLQQSSNSTLKSIGKAAAIANIIIKTAESAMAIYAGFATIPIIGPVLGVAGAAAAVAFGAEQVGRVNAAATGALVEGPGQKDTVPFMLTPGELVSPRKNFNEVVSGVQTERSGIIDEVRDRLSLLENSGGGGGVVVNIQGDFVGDEVFAQKIGTAISDQIQFNNLRFVGVNA